MLRVVYDRIISAVLGYDTYFRLAYHCTRLPFASTDQKITGSIRQYSLGIGADSVNEYIRLRDSVLHNCRIRFVKSLVAYFQEKCLKRSTIDDVRSMTERHGKLGLPGALGLLDCPDWELAKGLAAEQPKSIGKLRKPVIRLESIVDDRLQVWHMSSGLPGSANDTNVTDCSNLSSDI